MGERQIEFQRHGRTYQLSIGDADDLRAALELDDALWIATSAPVASLNCNAELLRFVDTDGNGQIRCDELREAIRWMLGLLQDTSGISTGEGGLDLEAVRTDESAGRALVETARFVLHTLGAGGQSRIDLSQVAAFEKDLDRQPINGDGIIPPEAAEDEELRQFIRDVLLCASGARDRTGRPGIAGEDLERFLSDAGGYLEWLARADRGEEEATEVMPLGTETPAAYAALRAVAEKIDDFFARCGALRFFGSAATSTLGISQTADGAGEDEPIQVLLRKSPLAEPNLEGALPLDKGLNPAYEDAVREFRQLVVRPIIGDKAELGEEDWNRIKAVLAPHESWANAKAGAAVEQLGREKLRRYVEADFAERVRRMLERDRAVADRLAGVRELKRLLLYHKYLLRLANNFVSFPELYDPGRTAMFEMGSLVIDARWFNFAVRVQNAEEHAKLAQTSRMYVLYVELNRDADSEKMLVAVPATAGTAGNLCVGKRGVFYGTDREVYHARVVRIIENPISFREALISPFVRLGRFIVGKIEAISAGAQQQLENHVGKATQGVQQGVEETVRRAPEVVTGQGQTAESAAQRSASRRDMLVGASVSIAALSSAFAFITKQLAGLTGWEIGLAFLILAAVVLIPTVVVAAVKLRRRDLSALLEGSGWAINARMRLNRRQRKQFTRPPSYPEDARGTPRRRWLRRLLVALLLALLLWAGVKALHSWRSRASQREPKRQQEQPGNAGAPPASAPEHQPGEGAGKGPGGG